MAIITPFPIILASASPRRKELLSNLITDFEIIVSHVDEDTLTHKDPFVTAETLATAKARVVAALYPESLVIGADTVVALGQLQLAKPSSPDEAVKMLTLLSKQEHQVITSVCLIWPGGEETFSVETRVKFRAISEEEIRGYVATGEPMDKAGAYAIQGGAGPFVEKIVGSRSNVIGLPLEELESQLKNI